jgi:hypothetical protein
VVTHGGSLRRIHEQAGFETDGIPNCSVWACTVEGDTIRPLD